jgi:hypothetical protein
MSFSHIKKDPTGTLNKYLLTPQQELQGQLLSQETQALLEQQATELAEEMLDFKFSGNQEEQLEQIRTFVFLQGQRTVLVNLLSNCSEAFARLSADSTDPQP